MLFHPFRIVYTVKEILMLRNIWTYNSISVLKISLPASFKLQRVFLDRGSCLCKRRWNSLYGHFSQKNAPVHLSIRARARASFIIALHPAALHGTRSGRVSLKKGVFGCEGNITLFSFVT